MTTELATRPNILKKDADGRWYSIPVGEEDAFVQAVEAIQNADFMSDEWSEANDDLNSRYGAYLKENQ